MGAAARKDWVDVQQLRSGVKSRTIPKCKGWHTIQEGWRKCGVNAAFFNEACSSGAGMVVRDVNGVFVKVRAVRFHGCPSVEEGEAMSLREALSWIKEMVWIREMLDANDNYTVNFVRRDANKLAHLFARSSKDIVVANVWDESPAFVESL
ncbi:uncharacterized protein LOC131025488 [Salvia miltiorrhiza]|uniref:uncharacterized protein LOC131025488 n=1 Tax=Salvia miltiorrhiza TaxID=226208 RepID=UPI0025ACE6D2|nr:uncharacterized protein LOC131025488 [Salvia miltiorrhiza]